MKLSKGFEINCPDVVRPLIQSRMPSSPSSDMGHIKSFGSGDDEKSKKICGGWVLRVEEMEHLRRTPYLYNASAGSVLELFCLQRLVYEYNMLMD